MPFEEIKWRIQNPPTVKDEINALANELKGVIGRTGGKSVDSPFYADPNDTAVFLLLTAEKYLIIL